MRQKVHSVSRHCVRTAMLGCILCAISAAQTTLPGGAAFFPQNLEEVDSITRKVAHDIRHQYTLTYNPGGLNAGAGYQRIEVEARAPGYNRLTVRTRSGYYPGEAVR